MVARTPALLASIPPGSLVVTGQPCPAVLLEGVLDRLRTGGRRYGWRTACETWQGETLEAQLEHARRDRRTIVVDLRDASWQGPSQRATLTRARQLVESGALARPGGKLVVWR